MKSPKKLVAGWLQRPQSTYRDGLVLALVAAILLSGLGYGLRAILAAIKVVGFHGSLPVWVAAVAGGLLLSVGVMFGVRKGSQLQTQISDLEARTTELQAYDLYAEHLRDALADLRRLLAGETHHGWVRRLPRKPYLGAWAGGLKRPSAAAAERHTRWFPPADAPYCLGCRPDRASDSYGCPVSSESLVPCAAPGKRKNQPASSMYSRAAA